MGSREADVCVLREDPGQVAVRPHAGSGQEGGVRLGAELGQHFQGCQVSWGPADGRQVDEKDELPPQVGESRDFESCLRLKEFKEKKKKGFLEKKKKKKKKKK